MPGVTAGLIDGTNSLSATAPSPGRGLGVRGSTPLVVALLFAGGAYVFSAGGAAAAELLGVEAVGGSSTGVALAVVKVSAWLTELACSLLLPVSYLRTPKPGCIPSSSLCGSTST